MGETTVTLFEDLIRQKNWRALRAAIEDIDPITSAGIIEDLSDEDDIIYFRLLPREHAKDTFQYLSHDKQEQIIEGLASNANRVAGLLNDLNPDDRTAFFEELPGNIAQRLIQMLSPEEKAIATSLLGYPEHSIGRLMTPEFVAVKPDFTVQQAIDHIRQFGRDSETLNVIYVVDDNWKLIDDIRMREIILADPKQPISDLMTEYFVALNAFDDQEVAIGIFQEQDRAALPVIDSRGNPAGNRYLRRCDGCG